MTNLVQFPGRPRPQPVTPRDELAALELELIRARLALVRSETRYVNSVWFWSCFKKAVFWAIMLWLIVMFASVGRAQSTTRSYHDSQRPVRSPIGDEARNFTQLLRSSGIVRRQRHQGTATRRTFYDGQGRYTGSSTGPRR